MEKIASCRRIREPARRAQSRLSRPRLSRPRRSRLGLPGLPGRGVALALLLLAGGCAESKLGGFDAPEGSSPGLAKMFGFSKPATGAAGEARGPRVSCPAISVLEGTAVERLYAGTPPSNANLRIQYALEDTARECSIRDDKLVLKVGVAGKVLLGPAGGPGNFTIPIRIAVVRVGDGTLVVSKLYRAAATIPAKRTEESFTVVSEPIVVPYVHEHAEEDYAIKVGIDSAGASKPAAGPTRRR